MVVQSACLAHDIGNPPFGHSGEDAIRYWFQQAAGRGWLDAMSEAERNDFLNFEGNAQGFRVLAQLEYHQFDGGPRMTYDTLGAYLKQPWTARQHDYLCRPEESRDGTESHMKCISRWTPYHSKYKKPRSNTQWK